MRDPKIPSHVFGSPPYHGEVCLSSYHNAQGLRVVVSDCCRAFFLLCVFGQKAKEHAQILHLSQVASRRTLLGTGRDCPEQALALCSIL